MPTKRGIFLNKKIWGNIGLILIDLIIFVHYPFYGYTRHINKSFIVRILETLYYKDRKKKSRVMCGILELAIGLRINNRNTWSSHQ